MPDDYAVSRSAGRRPWQILAQPQRHPPISMMLLSARPELRAASGGDLWLLFSRASYSPTTASSTWKTTPARPASRPTGPMRPCGTASSVRMAWCRSLQRETWRCRCGSNCMTSRHRFRRKPTTSSWSTCAPPAGWSSPVARITSGCGPLLRSRRRPAGNGRVHRARHDQRGRPRRWRPLHHPPVARQGKRNDRPQAMGGRLTSLAARRRPLHVRTRFVGSGRSGPPFTRLIWKSLHPSPRPSRDEAGIPLLVSERHQAAGGAFPRRMASSSSRPLARAAASTPMKQSPAPWVDRTMAGTAATRPRPSGAA